MRNPGKIGSCFYAIGIAGIGIQHFIYAEFRPMILSFWPATFPGQAAWAYIMGALLIISAMAIIFNKQGRNACLLLAIIFFLLFLFSHVYYQVFMANGEFQLASWTNPLKELAFSGGALIMAVNLPGERALRYDKLLWNLGRIFFSILLIVFGIDHFLYAKFVALLIPSWLPGPMFWTYFAAAALIGSGLCILLEIKLKLVAFLCGTMLLLWVILLHIPRAIAYPALAKGNELTSVFQALAFSGMAYGLGLPKPLRRRGL